jgi:hypothetical protein
LSWGTFKFRKVETLNSDRKISECLFVFPCDHSGFQVLKQTMPKKKRDQLKDQLLVILKKKKQDELYNLTMRMARRFVFTN